MLDYVIKGISLLVLLSLLLVEIQLVKELRENKKELQALRRGMTDLIVAVGVAQLLGIAVNRLDKWMSNR